MHTYNLRAASWGKNADSLDDNTYPAPDNNYQNKPPLIYTTIRQTKYIVMMTKEGSTKLLNFMAVVLKLKHGQIHVCHINEITIFPCNYSALMNIYQKSNDDLLEDVPKL